jgi:hypothetical protein
MDMEELPLLRMFIEHVLCAARGSQSLEADSFECLNEESGIYEVCGWDNDINQHYEAYLHYHKEKKMFTIESWQYFEFGVRATSHVIYKKMLNAAKAYKGGDYAQIEDIWGYTNGRFVVLVGFDEKKKHYVMAWR